MVENNKILSICIPNFNQGQALLRSIENLRPLNKFLNIEIIISDNGSNDTHSLTAMGVAAKEIREVKILEGPAGVLSDKKWFSGFGANLNRLISNSQGEYVWILGSGDLLDTRVIESLLKILELRKFDNIILTGTGYTGAVNQETPNLYGSRPPAILTAKFNETSGGPFFAYSISCNITRREIFELKKQDWEYQDSWPHIEYYLEYMSGDKTFTTCAIANEILELDQPVDGWYTKSDSLDIYLKLGILSEKYAYRKNAIPKKNSTLLFSNNLIKVVALLIHLRISSSNTSKPDRKLVFELLKTMTIAKQVYFLSVIHAPYRALRLLRFINSLAIKFMEK